MLVTFEHGRSLSCHTCCDTGTRLLWSPLEDLYSVALCEFRGPILTWILTGNGKLLLCSIYTSVPVICNLFYSAAYVYGTRVGVRGDEIRQGDLRILLFLSQMFMERMMQEN